MTSAKRPARKSTGKVALAFLDRVPSAYVFPIKPGAKAPPCFKDELKLATNDPAMAKRWAERWLGCNWGLAIKKSRLIVMDVDVKAGKVGQATLDNLEMMHGELPNTLTIRSPSGGLHYYFNETPAVPYVMRLSGFGKDVDSTNYVLLEGCTLVAGGKYEIINDAPIADAPAWFAEYLKPADAATVAQVSEVEPDQDANIAWAIDYLKRDAPPSIQGKNGENTMLLVYGTLKDCGISLYAAIDLVERFYNVPAKCDPLWNLGDGPLADRHDIKGKNAYGYLKQNAPGSATPEADFAAEPIDTNAINARIAADVARDSKSKQRTRKRGGIGDNSAGALSILNADEIVARNIEFIWKDRLARGKHTAMAGLGGKGKSQIFYDICARITKGAKWPDGGRAPKGTVIILSAEDGPADVMVPRLIAAGADLKLVKIVKATRDDKGEHKFSLQTDLDKLRALCEQIKRSPNIPPVMLIGFDPISSYMGGDLDTHRNSAVRSVLDPVTQLAEDVQCAVLSISHFNKGSNSQAINRVMESAAFVNAPRASFGVFDDPDNIGADDGAAPSRLFLPLKTNIGKLAQGWRYHIEEAYAGTDEKGRTIVTSRIVWDGAADLTADEVVQMEGERGAPRLDEASDFLREYLAQGPRPASDVKAEAEARGITEDTLRRARGKLRVKSEAVKGVPRGGWLWSLTERKLDLSAAQDFAEPDAGQEAGAAE